MQKYTAKQKAEALELYQEHGPSEASRRTGVGRTSISMWASEAGLTVRPKGQEAALEAAQKRFAEQRALLRPKLLATVHNLLARMEEPHQEFVGQHGKEVRYDRAPAGAVRSYATSVGILIDKMRLELGEHTSNERREDVSRVDRDIEALLGEMDRRDGGTGTADAHSNGAHA